MSLLFVSVVREGLSTSLTLADEGPASAALVDKPLAKALSFDVSATLGTTAAPKVTLKMLGPADVAGIDPRLVLRTDPPSGAQNVDRSLFPQVEFDLPGLPWMFTPLAPSNGRLRPWIALVVLPRGNDDDAPLDLKPLRHGRLPVLTVDKLEDLPPFDETWAWAHAQFATGGTTATPADLSELVRKHPEATLSRLLCPRQLVAGKHYVACVVPTFEASRTAGLGDEPDTTVNPAWGPTAKFPLRLPVYYHWEFFTGDAGNFEEAVRRLRGAGPPARAGRVVDASDPGPTAVRDPAAAALPLAGALRPEALQIQAYAGPAVAGFKQLARTGEVVTSPGGQTYPVVNVPLYAGKHVGITNVDAPAAPPWIRELNTDPRHRIAASLGTQIVRKNQEALMRSAWDQAGDIEEINRRMRRAKLGRAATARIVKRHFAPLPEADRLGALAPGFGRLALSSLNRTLAGLVGDSRLPDLVLSAPFRSLTRPGGRIGRRLASSAGIAPGVVEGIDGGAIHPDRSELTRTGELVTLDNVMNVVNSARTGPVPRVRPTLDIGVRPVATPLTTPGLETSIQVKSIAIPDGGAVGGIAGQPMTLTGSFTIPPPSMTGKIAVGGLSPASIRELPGRVVVNVGATAVDVTDAHKTALGALFEPLAPDLVTPPKALGIRDIAVQALSAIDPEITIARAVRAGMTLPEPAPGADPLDDVLAAPQFPAALAPELIRIAPDMLLPGLEEVEDDRVFAAVSNNAFVQALLAGANHEIMRELRWRGFPTDERGTSFHRFWRSDADDIPNLDSLRTGALGAAVTSGEGNVVVVIRSSLFRRFPGAQIFAVAPIAKKGAPASLDFSKPILPIFQGQLAPDVAYFGFAFTAKVATQSPGRYLVFQEPAGAPSFGLDLNGSAGFPAKASDLAWNHVTLAGPYVRADKRTQAFTDIGATWGESAADQAASTLQQPVRAAIHFRELIGTP